MVSHHNLRWHAGCTGKGMIASCDSHRAYCPCDSPQHEPKLVVLTGGPGAGKTAVLEVVRRHFCKHVLVLPEAAGIVFGGGFPRRESLPARCSAQRAIYRVQRELERLTLEERQGAVVLCDRGTVDGLAYWPDAAPDVWRELGTSLDAELARYAAVIHLRSPRLDQGYDRSNPLRVESAEEAQSVDERIREAWSSHPARTEVESTAEFFDKLRRAVDAIRAQVHQCCRTHSIEA